VSSDTYVVIAGAEDTSSVSAKPLVPFSQLLRLKMSRPGDSNSRRGLVIFESRKQSETTSNHADMSIKSRKYLNVLEVDGILWVAWLSNPEIPDCG
jgi:hypothetical protein